MTDVFKVLSIDGGGIRGVVPAMVLAEIEERTGRPAAERFDLIVGTSTGGILADRWTWLVVAAFIQLRLARACVADRRLPWERRYGPGRLTPIRVHRVVWTLLVELLGTPAKPPKPCGRSPGRPKGRLSGRAKRYPVLKKST